MTTATIEDKDEARKEMLKARSAAMEAKEKELNKSRSGPGTRVAVSMTRGKGSREVQYEAFDTSLKDTLPKTITEFAQLTKTTEEPTLVEYLIDGYNASQFAAAVDPTNDYVDSGWPDAVQKAFKAAVKGYVAGTGVSVEDAVKLIKPGFDAMGK